MNSGVFLWTADGGKTWQKGFVPTNFEVHCVESSGGPFQAGISGGGDHLDGDILRTAADADKFDGKGWRSRRCYRALFDIRAADKQNWIAVGSPVSVGFFPQPTAETYTHKGCRALFSSDAGVTWQVSKGSEGRGCLRSIAARTELPALAVGDGGAVLRSEDRGATWQTVESGVKNPLKGVAWGPGDKPVALAVGHKGTLTASRDLGKTWAPIPTATSGNYNAVAAVEPGFVVVGEKGLALRANP
jgi:hypothetical protein